MSIATDPARFGDTDNTDLLKIAMLVQGGHGGGGATVASIEFHVQPSGAQAGVYFTVQPVVRALKADNSVATNFNGAFQIFAAAESGSGHLSSTVLTEVVTGVWTGNFVNGVASGMGLSITAIGDYHLEAVLVSDPSITVDSSSFAVAIQTQAMDMVLSLTTTEGATGDVLTGTMLNAGSRGTNPGTWNTQAQGVDGALTFTKLSAASATALTVPLRVSGVNYDGTGANNRAVRFDCNNPAPADASATFETLKNIFSITESELQIVALVKLASGPDPDNIVSINNDWVHISGYAVGQQVQTGGDNILHAHGEGDLGNTIPDDPTKVLELVLTRSGVDRMGYLEMLDGNTLIGASDCIIAGGVDPGDVIYIFLQNYLTNRIGYSYFYVVGFRWTSTPRPSRPYTIPAVSSMDLSQSALNTLTLTFESVVTRFNMLVSVNGGSFVALETNLRLKTTTVAKGYDASGLTNGSTYAFRVVALIGSTQSTVVQSDPVQVNNAPFSGAYQDTIEPGSTDTDSLSNEYTLLAKLVISGGGSASKVRIYSGSSHGTTFPIKVMVYDADLNLLGQGSLAMGAGADAWTEVTLDSTIAGLTNGQVVWIGFLANTDNDYNFRYLDATAGNTNFNNATNYASSPITPFVSLGLLTRTYAAGLYVFTP